MQNISEKQGILTQNEVWQGTVRILGDVIIPENITVTVKAGCRLIFSETSNYTHPSKTELITRLSEKETCFIENLNESESVPSIIALGTFVCLGEKEKKINIGTVGWNGFIVLGQNSLIEHCNITGAAAVVSAQQTQIKHSNFDFCKAAVYALGKVNISYCSFTYNTIAIALNSPEATLYKNTITGCAFAAINVIASGKVNILKNIICSNLAAIYAQTSKNINIYCNYIADNIFALNLSYISVSKCVHNKIINTTARPFGADCVQSLYIIRNTINTSNDAAIVITGAARDIFIKSLNVNSSAGIAFSSLARTTVKNSFLKTQGPTLYCDAPGHVEVENSELLSEHTPSVIIGNDDSLNIKNCHITADRANIISTFRNSKTRISDTKFYSKDEYFILAKEYSSVEIDNCAVNACKFAGVEGYSDISICANKIVTKNEGAYLCSNAKLSIKDSAIVMQNEANFFNAVQNTVLKIENSSLDISGGLVRADGNTKIHFTGVTAALKHNAFMLYGKSSARVHNCKLSSQNGTLFSCRANSYVEVNSSELSAHNISYQTDLSKCIITDSVASSGNNMSDGKALSQLLLKNNTCTVASSGFCYASEQSSMLLETNFVQNTETGIIANVQSEIIINNLNINAVEKLLDAVDNSYIKINALHSEIPAKSINIKNILGLCLREAFVRCDEIQFSGKQCKIVSSRISGKNITASSTDFELSGTELSLSGALNVKYSNLTVKNTNLAQSDINLDYVHCNILRCAIDTSKFNLFNSLVKSNESNLNSDEDLLIEGFSLCSISQAKINTGYISLDNIAFLSLKNIKGSIKNTVCKFLSLLNISDSVLHTSGMDIVDTSAIKFENTFLESAYSGIKTSKFAGAVILNSEINSKNEALVFIDRSFLSLQKSNITSKNLSLRCEDYAFAHAENSRFSGTDGAYVKNFAYLSLNAVKAECSETGILSENNSYLYLDNVSISAKRAFETTSLKKAVFKNIILTGSKITYKSSEYSKNEINGLTLKGEGEIRLENFTSLRLKNVAGSSGIINTFTCSETILYDADISCAGISAGEASTASLKKSAINSATELNATFASQVCINGVSLKSSTGGINLTDFSELYANTIEINSALQGIKIQDNAKSALKNTEIKSLSIGLQTSDIAQTELFNITITATNGAISKDFSQISLDNVTICAVETGVRSVNNSRLYLINSNISGKTALDNKIAHGSKFKNITLNGSSVNYKTAKIGKNEIDGLSLAGNGDFILSGLNNLTIKTALGACGTFTLNDSVALTVYSSEISCAKLNSDTSSILSLENTDITTENELTLSSAAQARLNDIKLDSAGSGLSLTENSEVCAKDLKLDSILHAVSTNDNAKSILKNAEIKSLSVAVSLQEKAQTSINKGCITAETGVLLADAANAQLTDTNITAEETGVESADLSELELNNVNIGAECALEITSLKKAALENITLIGNEINYNGAEYGKNEINGLTLKGEGEIRLENFTVLKLNKIAGAFGALKTDDLSAVKIKDGIFKSKKFEISNLGILDLSKCKINTSHGISTRIAAQLNLNDVKLTSAENAITTSDNGEIFATSLKASAKTVCLGVKDNAAVKICCATVTGADGAISKNFSQISLDNVTVCAVETGVRSSDLSELELNNVSITATRALETSSAKPAKLKNISLSATEINYKTIQPGINEIEGLSLAGNGEFLLSGLNNLSLKTVLGACGAFRLNDSVALTVDSSEISCAKLNSGTSSILSLENTDITTENELTLSYAAQARLNDIKLDSAGAGLGLTENGEVWGNEIKINSALQAIRMQDNAKSVLENTEIKSLSAAVSLQEKAQTSINKGFISAENGVMISAAANAQLTDTNITAVETGVRSADCCELELNNVSISAERALETASAKPAKLKNISLTATEINYKTVQPELNEIDGLSLAGNGEVYVTGLNHLNIKRASGTTGKINITGGAALILTNSQVECAVTADSSMLGLTQTALKTNLNATASALLNFNEVKLESSGRAIQLMGNSGLKGADVKIQSALEGVSQQDNTVARLKNLKIQSALTAVLIDNNTQIKIDNADISSDTQGVYAKNRSVIELDGSNITAKETAVKITGNADLKLYKTTASGICAFENASTNPAHLKDITLKASKTSYKNLPAARAKIENLKIKGGDLNIDNTAELDINKVYGNFGILKIAGAASVKTKNAELNCKNISILAAGGFSLDKALTRCSGLEADNTAAVNMRDVKLTSSQTSVTLNASSELSAHDIKMQSLLNGISQKDFSKIKMMNADLKSAKSALTLTHSAVGAIEDTNINTGALGLHIKDFAKFSAKKVNVTSTDAGIRVVENGFIEGESVKVNAPTGIFLGTNKNITFNGVSVKSDKVNINTQGNGAYQFNNASISGGRLHAFKCGFTGFDNLKNSEFESLTLNDGSSLKIKNSLITAKDGFAFYDSNLFNARASEINAAVSFKNAALSHVKDSKITSEDCAVSLRGAAQGFFTDILAVSDLTAISVGEKASAEIKNCSVRAPKAIQSENSARIVCADTYINADYCALSVTGGAVLKIADSAVKTAGIFVTTSEHARVEIKGLKASLENKFVKKTNSTTENTFINSSNFANLTTDSTSLTNKSGKPVSALKNESLRTCVISSSEILNFNKSVSLNRLSDTAFKNVNLSSSVDMLFLAKLRAHNINITAPDSCGLSLAGQSTLRAYDINIMSEQGINAVDAVDALLENTSIKTQGISADISDNARVKLNEASISSNLTYTPQKGTFNVFFASVKLAGFARLQIRKASVSARSLFAKLFEKSSLTMDKTKIKTKEGLRLTGDTCANISNTKITVENFGTYAQNNAVLNMHNTTVSAQEGGVFGIGVTANAKLNAENSEISNFDYALFKYGNAKISAGSTPDVLTLNVEPDIPKTKFLNVKFNAASDKKTQAKKSANLKRFVLNTRHLIAFKQAYCLAYMYALNSFKKAVKKMPFVNTLYLRRGLLNKDWIAGSSDIDLLTVVKSASATELKMLFKTYNEKKLNFPFMGENLILTVTELPFYLTAGGLRAAESAKWKLLSGKKINFVSATSYQTSAFLYADVYAELLNSYVLFSGAFLNRKDTNYHALFSKTLADILKFTHIIKTSDVNFLKYSRTDFLNYYLNLYPDNNIKQVQQFWNKNIKFSRQTAASIFNKMFTLMDEAAKILNKSVIKNNVPASQNREITKISDDYIWNKFKVKVRDILGSALSQTILDTPGNLYIIVNDFTDAAQKINKINAAKKQIKRLVQTPLMLFSKNMFEALTLTLFDNMPLEAYKLRQTQNRFERRQIDEYEPFNYLKPNLTHINYLMRQSAASLPFHIREAEFISSSAIKKHQFFNHFVRSLSLKMWSELGIIPEYPFSQKIIDVFISLFPQYAEQVNDIVLLFSKEEYLSEQSYFKVYNFILGTTDAIIKTETKNV
jgi:hypothetical protein